MRNAKAPLSSELPLDATAASVATFTAATHHGTAPLATATARRRRPAPGRCHHAGEEAGGGGRGGGAVVEAEAQRLGGLEGRILVSVDVLRAVDVLWHSGRSTGR